MNEQKDITLVTKPNSFIFKNFYEHLNSEHHLNWPSFYFTQSEEILPLIAKLIVTDLVKSQRIRCLSQQVQEFLVSESRVSVENDWSTVKCA